MVTHYNPSLSQELRYQSIPVVPLKATETLLDWLKRTGRLKLREIETFQENEIVEELDDVIDPEVYQREEEE